jgi:hypothetical protein
MTDLETLPTRAAIDALQAQFASLPQAEFPTKHYFANGLYVREMSCKAGSAIIGKVHKTQHVFVLAAGDMTLVSDGKRIRVSAPWVSIAEPGIKRLGYAHTDCVCLNIHHTDLTDLKEIEAALVENDPTALFDEGNNLKAPALENRT